jgi:hypothetical protein
MAIERSIDFAAIDKLRQIFQRMDLPLLQIGRINNSFPVFVGKPAVPIKMPIFSATRFNILH